MENRKRPTGVTLLAVLLILIAFRGISSLLAIMGSGDGLPSDWIANASAPDFYNAGFKIAYTVSAALAAIAVVIALVGIALTKSLKKSP